tara:strand:- start:1322 stop:1483 length:162 start_codon:yes stop_codon:yes gene_type:complete
MRLRPFDFRGSSTVLAAALKFFYKWENMSRVLQGQNSQKNVQGHIMLKTGELR